MYDKINGIVDYFAKWKKTDTEMQIPHFLSFVELYTSKMY